MIRSISVVVVALSLWGFASDSAVNSGPNGQTAAQSPDHAEAVRLSATIAGLYKQGKYDEAIPLAKRVLEIERGLGPERPEVALALANLAELYIAKKNNGDAEKLFQEAAAIYDKNQMSSIPVSDVLERLAQISFLGRKYENSIRLLERALAIREKSYGAESSQVAETLHELANVYQVDHQYWKAEPLYLRSITIKEKILGRTNPTTVQAMKDYACLRVKNMPVRVDKEEKKAELTAAEIEQQSVIERASCWLFGFKDDCDKVSFNPRLRLPIVVNGRAVKLAQPPYPPAAREKHLSGTIYVAVLIDEKGSVIKVKPVCGGYREFDDVANTAARASKFSPTKLDDRPVQVTGLITYRFVAQ